MTTTIKKLLIANRGEIAVRVIRACRELGIATVAVFSEADREALHVLLADEAHPIGPPPAAESYLAIDKLVAVAAPAGADAVHPGYGFLAENARFAEACGQAGLTFVGPPPAAIRAMGDKTAARKIARDLEGADGAGHARSPSGPTTRRARWRRAGRLPGDAQGGDGRRRQGHAPGPRSEAELTDALRAARSEAGAAFGDAAVYLERAVDRAAARRDPGAGRRARHRRAPGRARVLDPAAPPEAHRGDRPSPFVDAELRARMGEAACRVARAVGYVNAGTVEFLLDAERNFYFLEMNTRLQVEHPVTELVTGHRPRARAAAHRGRASRSATRRPT